jgi:hypothetical protein
MADTITNKAAYLEQDASKEAVALEALLADFRDMIADDPDLALDLAEGQTNAMEIIDALILADGLDTELAAGAKTAKKVIDDRAKRFEARIERRRAIIERFMLIMDQKKLERPVATISLAKRKLTIEVVDESALPSEYFKQPDPVLDKTKLNDAVAKIMAAREAELEAAKAEGREPNLPALPDGVALGNGGVNLTVRRR